MVEEVVCEWDLEGWVGTGRREEEREEERKALVA